MATPRSTERRDLTSDAAIRRRLVLLASAFAILAFLHFVDHGAS